MRVTIIFPSKERVEQYRKKKKYKNLQSLNEIFLCLNRIRSSSKKTYNY